MARRTSTSGKHILLYASSDTDANIFYATRFSCPDPFLFIRTAQGRRIYVMSDLEIDRARATTNAHRVLPMSRYVAAARTRRRGQPHVADVIAEVLRDLRIRAVTVPESFPAGIADRLRRRHVRVTAAKEPFFPRRARKSEQEIAYIRTVMRATEKGLAAAVDILRRSRIRNGWVMWEGRRLTSEFLRRAIDETVFSHGCIATHTIVAAGKHGCDPHNAGSGPIRANTPIIIDIFPRSESTGYFGDMTRTFVKGRASERVRRMYKAVFDAQRRALRMIRPGVDGRDIHEAIQGLFGSRGFETGEIGGRMQGFFHGTGHGLGLEIHEPPRIATVSSMLRKDMVVTVEPGLYYWPVGGVRIEDTVLVTEDGIRSLTRFPKTLEIK